VSFTVGVATSAKTVRDAFRANNAKTHAVIDALKKAGVSDSEIQTTNFSIDQPYDAETRKRLDEFLVSNNVTVTRRDPSSVSDLLQAAIDAGANQAGGLVFFVAHPAAARDEALAAAYADARGRAEKLAAAAKRMLGAATVITTVPMPYGYAQNNVAEAITVSADTPAIETGVTRITETVTVTFELK
jgi:uncharacterized protein YggE